MDDLELQRLAGDAAVPLALLAASLPLEERPKFWGKIASMIMTTGYIIAGEAKHDGVFDHAAALKWLSDATEVAKHDTKLILDHPELR